MELAENLLMRLGVKDKSEHLWNCDEAGLKLDPNIKYVFARRGAKTVPVVVPTEGKEQFTVLVCGNAAGRFLPPFVINKAANTYFEWSQVDQIAPYV